MEAIMSYRWDETDILGVTKCIEMAMRCVEDDRDRRPSITEMLDELKKLDSEMEELLKEDPKPIIGQRVQYIRNLHILLIYVDLVMHSR